MSSQIPLLQVPLKQTDSVDFIDPLSKHIASTYNQNADDYRTECQALNTCRQDAVDAGADVSGRNAIFKYYTQLDLLEARFPVQEGGVDMHFTWFDAFSSKKVSQNSLAFEKAAVVFNLGAVCSAIAATQDRSQAMGIKTAFNYLQVAAGQFQFINDHFMHPPSVDMSRDSVRFLTDLMLAQAQECFIENGLIDGKKGKLIARLSFQLSQAYSGIIDLLADPILAAQMDPIWLQVLKTKYKYFKALGYYHLSLQYEADGMYGIIVTLMDAAEGPIRESTAFANLIGTNSGTPILSSFANAMLGGGLGDGDVALQSAAKALLEMVKTLYQLIMMRKTSSTKDNDLIYHEPVPSVATLGTPDMLCAVKPVPIAQIFPNGQVDLQQIAGHDIFRKLIPIQAHESASLYSQAKDALYRDISSRVREIDESVEATLLSLDFHKVIIQLKQSLKNAEPEFSLPQDLSDSIQTFKRDSNNDIEHIRLAIINLKQSFKEEIDKLFLSLNEEQQSCERKRTQYQAQWTQEPSFAHSRSMHHNLNRYAANFEAGCNNDMLWEPLILKLDPFLRILKVDIQKIIAKYLADLSDAISKAVPHVPANLLVDDSGLGVIEEQVVVEKLESMYQKLRSMKAERMAVLARFRDMINNDDITGILVLNPGREGSIIQQEKSKFVPITGQLKQECNSSAQLLQGLVSEFDKLKTQGYTIRNIEIKESIKAQISEDWMMSIQSVFELRNAMNDAHNFYKELRDSVEQIGIQINQFVNGRKSEARVLSQRIDFLQTHSLQDHMAQTRISEAAAYPTTQDPRAMNQSIYQMPSIDADSLSPGYNNDMSRRESKSNSPKGFSQPPAAHYYYQQNLHNQNIERESYTSTGGNVHVRQTQIPPVYGQSYAEHSNVQPNYDTSFSDHSEKYHIAPQSQVPHQQSYSPAVGGLPPPVPFDQPVNSVGMGNIRPYVMPSNMAGNYHQAGSYPRLNEPMHGNPISSPPLYSNSQPSFYHHNQDAYSNQSPLHGHLQDQSPGQPRVPNQEQGLLD